MDHRPQRVEGPDHHEHDSAVQHRPRERSDPEQIEGEQSPRSISGLLDVHRGDEWEQGGGRDGDDDEWGGDSERSDEHRRDRRAHREPEHVGGEQATEILAEVLRIGEDDDPLDRRRRRSDSDAGDDATDQDHRQRGSDRHQQESGNVDRYADDHDGARVSPIGERRDRHLRDERGDEACADHDTDRCLADAVLVAVIVDDREQHAVAGREQRAEAAERDHQERRRGPFPLAWIAPRQQHRWRLPITPDRLRSRSLRCAPLRRTRHARRGPGHRRWRSCWRSHPTRRSSGRVPLRARSATPRDHGR